MKRNVFRWTLLAAAASGALALAACHSSTTTNIETNVSNLEVTVNETNMTTEAANVITPLPAGNTTTTSAPSAPGNDFDTSRTQDDADATGMTARTTQDDGNTGTPAQ